MVNMEWFKVVLIVFAIIFQSVIGDFLHHKDEKQLELGKTYYQNALQESKMPKYGDCWTDAIRKLEQGCKKLTDDVQQSLALQFANCFLEKAGQKTYPCKEDSDIRQCFNEMNDRAFTAYNNFFTHTQSICYFLQTQIWQEETEITVLKLSDNAARVVKTLEDTNQMQDSILAASNKVIAQQDRLLESSSLLGQALDNSKDSVKNMLDEFRSSTSEQRNLIFDLFDRLSKLQNLFLGEVSGFYSLIFYPTALLTVYLLTSTSRTASARLWLFCMFCCSFGLERLVVNITITDSSDLPADVASEEIYWRIWLVRKITMLLCAALLGYTAYKFQDLNIINNQILLNVQRRLELIELKGYSESIGIRGTSSRKHFSTDVTDHSMYKKHFLTRHDSDDESDNLSYDSEESDSTFVPSSEESFDTASSRLSISMSMSSNFASPEVAQPNIPEIIGGLVKAEIKPERSASRNRSSRCTTPVVTSQPSASPYNLRSRSARKPLNILHTESPDTVNQMIKQLERTSRQNTSMIREKVINNNIPDRPNYFSSDDEQ